MLALIVPPVAKPCEPLIGAYSLARLLRRQDVACTLIDANLSWFHNQLWGSGRPAIATGSAGEPEGRNIGRRLQRALRHTTTGNPLRDPTTYESRDRHQQAVEHLEAVLRASALSADEQPGLADFRIQGRRPVVRKDLVDYMERPTTVFDDYLVASLIPKLAAIHPDIIGFSVTFLHQMFAAVRMARIIRDAFPSIPLVLGGALVECWNRADWTLPPFHLFEAVISLQATSWETWQRRFHLPVSHPYGHAFFPDTADVLGKEFFTPEPVFPLALGLGCAWGHCTFCPDYQRHPYQSAQDPSWLSALEQMLPKHRSLVLHLTDSCVPPQALDRLADALQERGWPVRWYAFVRLEKTLLQPGRLERWARGGCQMLQFGLETAAPDLLKAMHKGIQLKHAATILQRAADLGIRNYVYLLFGFPGEKTDHLHQTMDFIIRHQEAIHYLNNALFNLPKESPMAKHPEAFAIRKLRPFPGEDSDLSIYLDFDDDQGSARKRARSFLQRTFLADAAIRQRVLNLPSVFKSNHAVLAHW
jgi:hypothetical protein